MQKVFNVLSVVSFALVTVGTAVGVNIYVNREAIVQNIKEQALDAVTNGMVSDADLGVKNPVSIPTVPFKP